MDRAKEDKMAEKMKEIRKDRRGSTGTIEDYIRQKRERKGGEKDESGRGGF